jgi:aryl-alcohol dehydrogenase-like predicted oxidoreductase
MKYRPLGKTNLRVSGVSLGTVELGVQYGIAVPGDFGRPPEDDAVRLLAEAADAGINFFDTAPGYGESERLLGQALGRRADCFFATKVSVPRAGNVRAAIESSIESSLKTLRRDAIDVVQIHNATLEVLRQGELAAILQDARQRGIVRFLGASVYTEDEALAVLEDDRFDVLQVAFNILDQRMAAHVFPAARRAGVGVLVRSAFLKGVLTDKAWHLPPELSVLQSAAEKVKDAVAGSWDAMPEVALRFCLSAPEVGTVLVGARTRMELQQALKAESQGPLSAEILETARGLALADERLLNPSTWPVA